MCADVVDVLQQREIILEGSVQVQEELLLVTDNKSTEQPVQ